MLGFFMASLFNPLWIPLKPPVKLAKPSSAIGVSSAVRPLDLNDEMIMINNTISEGQKQFPPHYSATTKKAPSIGYAKDSEPETVVGPVDIPIIQVDLPSIQVDEWYDDEDILETTNAECNNVLSSPVC